MEKKVLLKFTGAIPKTSKCLVFGQEKSGKSHLVIDLIEKGAGLPNKQTKPPERYNVIDTNYPLDDKVVDFFSDSNNILNPTLNQKGFIITNEHPLNLPVQLRDQVEYIFILQMTNINYRKKLYSGYIQTNEHKMPQFTTLESFCTTLDQVTTTTSTIPLPTIYPIPQGAPNNTPQTKTQTINTYDALLLHRMIDPEYTAKTPKFGKYLYDVYWYKPDFRKNAKIDPQVLWFPPVKQAPKIQINKITPVFQPALGVTPRKPKVTNLVTEKEMAAHQHQVFDPFTHFFDIPKPPTPPVLISKGSAMLEWWDYFSPNENIMEEWLNYE